MKHSQHTSLVYLHQKPVEYCYPQFTDEEISASITTSLFRAPSSHMLEGVGLRYLFGKLRGLLRCGIPREGSPPTGATSHQLWSLEGQWGKVEGIGTGARKGCKSAFDQKEGRARLRGLRPGFPSQLSRELAGCDSLGQPFTVSQDLFYPIK